MEIHYEIDGHPDRFTHAIVIFNVCDNINVYIKQLYMICMYFHCGFICQILNWNFKMKILAVTAGCVEMFNNPADIFWLV